MIDVCELDGFLTAIVSGPVLIVPSRWLRALILSCQHAATSATGAMTRAHVVAERSTEGALPTAKLPMLVAEAA